MKEARWRYWTRVVAGIVGVCLAIYGWGSWIVVPTSAVSASVAGIVLALSYPFLRMGGSGLLPLCVFVVSALVIVILAGLRIFPGRYLIEVYVFLPPALGLSMALLRFGLRRSDIS